MIAADRMFREDIKKVFAKFKNEVLPYFQIIGVCIVGSVIYGIAHDMITAHVAVEYFTVYHPKIIESQSPIAIALLWGVIATWWMGAFFGALLSFAARVGDLPKLSWRAIVKPVALVLVTAWLMAMVIGLLVYVFVRYRQGAGGQSFEYERRLMAVGTIHLCSYGLSALGGLGLTGWAISHRWKQRMSL